MNKQNITIEDTLNFRRTDTCLVCFPSNDPVNSFLKFHPEDNKESSNKF